MQLTSLLSKTPTPKHHGAKASGFMFWHEFSSYADEMFGTKDNRDSLSSRSTSAPATCEEIERSCRMCRMKCPHVTEWKHVKGCHTCSLRIFRFNPLSFDNLWHELAHIFRCNSPIFRFVFFLSRFQPPFNDRNLPGGHYLELASISSIDYWILSQTSEMQTVILSLQGEPI